MSTEELVCDDTPTTGRKPRLVKNKKVKRLVKKIDRLVSRLDKMAKKDLALNQCVELHVRVMQLVSEATTLNEKFQTIRLELDQVCDTE